MVSIKASKSPSRSPQSQGHLKVKIILKSRAFQIKSVNISISIPKQVVGFEMNAFLFLDIFCMSNFILLPHGKYQYKGNVSGHVQHVYSTSIPVWLI